MHDRVHTQVTEGGTRRRTKYNGKNVVTEAVQVRFDKPVGPDMPATARLVATERCLDVDRVGAPGFGATL